MGKKRKGPFDEVRASDASDDECGFHISFPSVPPRVGLGSVLRGESAVYPVSADDRRRHERSWSRNGLRLPSEVRPALPEEEHLQQKGGPCWGVHRPELRRVRCSLRRSAQRPRVWIGKRGAGVHERDRVDRIQQILSAGAKPCTDWVWCDPYEALAGTNECSKKLGPDYDGADYNGTEVEDPFASDNCLGRWRGGELTSYSGYGQDLYLHGTVKGCVTSSGNVIPAGSCQLKNIVSKKYEDHLYSDENDDDVYGSNLMSGMCDWTLDPKH